MCECVDVTFKIPFHFISFHIVFFCVCVLVFLVFKITPFNMHILIVIENDNIKT